MRGAGDGDLLVCKVRVLAHEQERLQRLGRRAHERDEVRVAVSLDELAVAHLDRVHAVARLDDASSLHGYADRIHGGNRASRSWGAAGKGAERAARRTVLSTAKSREPKAPAAQRRQAAAKPGFARRKQPPP